MRKLFWKKSHQAWYCEIGRKQIRLGRQNDAAFNPNHRLGEQSGKAISVEPVEPPTMPVFSFGEVAAGEVYFMTTEGIINRFVSQRGN